MLCTVGFLLFFVVVSMKLSLQDETEITTPCPGCVFEKLKVSSLDKWTPGPQKRSVMTSEEGMEVVHSLRK